MPSLTLPSLRAQIQSGKLAPVYVFHGEDTRLMEQITDSIEALVDPADRPFAVERLYAGEEGGSPLDIAAAANVFPMLGGQRIIFVLRAERLLKPKRGGKASDTAESGADDEGGEADADAAGGGPLDAAPLEDYVERPSPTTVLVFVATGIDKTRRLTKRLVEKAACVTFGGLAADRADERRELRQQMVADLQREIAAAGRRVEPKALELLVDRAGGDVSKARGDLERLLLYTQGQPSIGRADVDEVVTAETYVDDWAVVNAIGDGDLPRVLREVALRCDRGDSPHQMIGQLRWWVSTRLAPAAPERIKPALDALLRADLALKSSGGDSRTLLERLVVDLTGRPLPKQGWGPGRR